MLHIDVKRIRNLQLLLDQMSYYIIASNVVKTAINSLPEKTKLFIQLFHLNKVINALKFKHIFGSEILDDLLELNLLVVNGNNIRSNYSIASLNDCYIVHETGRVHKRLDYAYFSRDSCILEKHLPFNFNAIKILDLCSGTGIQAILLSRNGRKIIGVELSHEVANVGRFNTILNNVEKKVKILQGDLYAPVKNMKFDLVVSNPPFIPVPDTLQYPLCGRGGRDGLLVLKNIFNNISNHMTKNGIGLILGITYGDHRYPFVLNLLKKIAKRDRLAIDVIVLERHEKRKEILFRSSFLLKHNPDSEFDPMVEMSKIYDQAKAEYLYTYLVKIRKAKYNVNLINLFPKYANKKKVEISENTSLKSLYVQLVNVFLEGQYNKAIDIYMNMEKFNKLFALKYERDVSFILGVSYERLRRYKKAIIELRKAEKINPGEAQINFSLFRCYRHIGEIKEADRELKKWFLKLKKSKYKRPQKLNSYFSRGSRV